MHLQSGNINPKVFWNRPGFLPRAASILVCGFLAVLFLTRHC